MYQERNTTRKTENKRKQEGMENQLLQKHAQSTQQQKALLPSQTKALFCHQCKSTVSPSITLKGPSSTGKNKVCYAHLATLNGSSRMFCLIISYWVFETRFIQSRSIVQPKPEIALPRTSSTTIYLMPQQVSFLHAMAVSITYKQLQQISLKQ